jgi:hypothetical protein
MNTIYNKTTQSNKLYETWTISDHLVECTSVAPQQCMQISRNGASIELFYDQIDGFDYVPGYEYILQVMGTKIDNPPADASTMRRSLVNMQSHKSTTGKPDTLPQP